MSLLVCSKVVGRQRKARTLLRDWRIVSLGERGEELSFTDLFTGIVEHRFDPSETLSLPSVYTGQPILCEIGQSKSGDFQTVPVHVQVAEAVALFGIYIQFVIDAAAEKEVSFTYPIDSL